MKNKLKKFINSVLGRVFDLRLYSVRSHGRDDVVDISNIGHELNIIFDVGANLGQTVSKFINGFPNSKIYAFEPVTKTYNVLEKNFSQEPNVTIAQLALGDNNGSMDIFIPKHKTMASLIQPVEYLESERVTVKTIDTYCQDNGISRIDLLKIDAEGYDLQVLKGATEMLRDQKIKLVLVELGFERNNKCHVSFDTVKEYLEEFGFNLFGIYDQQLEWSGEKKLRYANVCFINTSALDDRELQCI